MKLWRYLVPLLLLSIPVFAQQSELNSSEEPYNSPSPVLSEEIWGELQTDYFSSEIEVNRLTVDAESYLGEVAPEIENCSGALPSQPTYVIQWDRTAYEEELPVRFFATSDEDLILVILEPDGDWHCEDDYETSTNPMVIIDSLRSGAYTIWVGSKTNDEIFVGRLFVSIGNHTPLPPPRSCCDGLSFSNPASTDSEASVTYIEVDALDGEDEGILVSTDIIYRGESGTQFITELFVYDMDGNEIVIDDVDNRDEECASSTQPCDAESLRRTSSRRDFSVGSRRGPVEFVVNSLNVEDFGEAYYLDIIVSILDEDGEVVEVADQVTIGLDD